MWRTMFSIITIASSTTKPVPMVSAISDRLSSEKPANHITRNVAISDSGSATPAMMVARIVRRKMNTTSTTSADREHERELHVADRGADRVGAVVHHGELGADGQDAAQPRQLVLDVLDRLHHVGAGLAADIDDDGLLAVVPAADLGVLQSVDDLGDVAQHHRLAVAIGDDQRAIGLGGGELVVRRDGVGLERAVERALRPGHIGVHDRLRGCPRARAHRRRAAAGRPGCAPPA